ncbi:hypothetical protein HHI36_007737 [Cryptolaemus montrouzieri]|uniref:Uncharacterized protein n=1 Tax=Cryptolaemus montrouzieri TaxID=559131 RepID=A0ABD2MQK8_9CUCU
MYLGTSIEVESISTTQNTSPIPSRHLKVNRHNLLVPEQCGSKLTINTAFGSGIIEVPEENRRGLRPRRVLSSIASSCDESNKGNVIKVRESKSLDPLPPFKSKLLDPVSKLLNANRSTRSLDNCDKRSKIQIIAITDENIADCNYANGNIVVTSNDDNNFVEDVQVPLLNANPNPTIIRKRGGNGCEDPIDNNDTSKRWRSLESVQVSCEPLQNSVKNKKVTPRHSLKTWLLGLFSGNGLKTSNASLKKAVITDFPHAIERDKESVI